MDLINESTECFPLAPANFRAVRCVDARRSPQRRGAGAGGAASAGEECYDGRRGRYFAALTSLRYYARPNMPPPPGLPPDLFYAHLGQGAEAAVELSE